MCGPLRTAGCSLAMCLARGGRRGRRGNGRRRRCERKHALSPRRTPLRRREGAPLRRPLFVHVVGLRRQQQRRLLLLLLLLLRRLRRCPLLLLLLLLQLLLRLVFLPLLLLLCHLAMACSKLVALELAGPPPARLAGLCGAVSHCSSNWLCLGLLRVVLDKVHPDAVHGDGVNAVDLQPLRRAADTLPPIAAAEPFIIARFYYRGILLFHRTSTCWAGHSP